MRQSHYWTHLLGLGVIGISAAAGHAATAPLNDNFASAETISGNAGSIAANNNGATKEADEPNHAGNSGEQSVWFRWLAPATGSADISISGESSLDTVMSVYTGSSVSALATIASGSFSLNWTLPHSFAGYIHNYVVRSPA